MKSCHKCGTQLIADAALCSNCGTSQDAAQQSSSSQNDLSNATASTSGYGDRPAAMPAPRPLHPDQQRQQDLSNSAYGGLVMISAFNVYLIAGTIMAS